MSDVVLEVVCLVCAVSGADGIRSSSALLALATY